jgi:hypothetical protein
MPFMTGLVVPTTTPLLVEDVADALEVAAVLLADSVAVELAFDLVEKTPPITAGGAVLLEVE